MNDIIQNAKQAPKHVQILVASVVALVGVVTWAVPQLIDVRDQLAHGRLERVNIMAASELFGAKAVEACHLDTISTTVQAFEIGVLVKVKTDNGANQRQFFPKQGIDGFLASRTSFLSTRSAFAGEGGSELVCIEELLELIDERTAVVQCIFPNECVEKYVLDLGTGEKLELLSPPCFKLE